MLMVMWNSAPREGKEKFCFYKKRGNHDASAKDPHDLVISRDQSNGRGKWCLGLTLSQAAGVEGLMPKLSLSETGCREFPRLAGVRTRERGSSVLV